MSNVEVAKEQKMLVLDAKVKNLIQQPTVLAVPFFHAVSPANGRPYPASHPARRPSHPRHKLQQPRRSLQLIILPTEQRGQRAGSASARAAGLYVNERPPLLVLGARVSVHRC